MQVGYYFTSSGARNGVPKRGATNCICCCFYQSSGEKPSTKTKYNSKNYKIYNGNFKGH